MTTRAHPGHVRRPGLTSGLTGTVVARPMATNELLSLPDGFAAGPAKVGTDDNGDLQGDGLVVDYVAGLLWDVDIEFQDPDLGTKNLGVLDLNTDGEPLHEIVATDIHVISATEWLDIQGLIADIAAGTSASDIIVSPLINDGASAVSGELDEREVGINVVSRGLLANGTNELTAFLALNTEAIAAGVPLIIPKGKTVGVGTLGLTLPSNSWIAGKGTIQPSGACTNVVATAVSATNVRVEGITIANATYGQNSFNMGVGSDTVKIIGVNFVGDGSASGDVGVNLSAGTYANIYIEDCDFSGYTNNIRSQANAGGNLLRIRDNRITSWGSRGIYIQTGSTTVWDDVEVLRNRIKGLVAGSQVRYPIRIEQSVSTDLQHTNVKVDDNRVFGPGVPYVGTNTSPWTGTADQISITGVKGGSVSGNTSVGGGEAGLTVTNCTDVGVSGNRIRDCGISGICVGANGLVTPGTHDIRVTGNNIFGAGYDTVIDHSDCAIRTYDADNVLIEGNLVGNLAGVTAATAHAISYTDTNGLTVGVNHFHGLTGTTYYDNGGNTNVTLPQAVIAAPVKLVQSGGDLTLPQSDNTTQTPVPGATNTLPAGTYLMTGYIEYEASLTADVKFRINVSATTSSGTWTVNGIRSSAPTAGSTADTITRAAVAFTSTSAVGGTNVGTNLSCSPTGRIVVTAGGTAFLAASQNTAEASDVKVRNAMIVFTPV